MLKINRLPCKSSARRSLASSVHTRSLGSVFPAVTRMETLGLQSSEGLPRPAAGVGADEPGAGAALRAPGWHSQPAAICKLSQWPQLSQKPFFQLDFQLGMRLCVVPRAWVWLEVVDSAFPMLLILPSPPIASWFLVLLLHSLC